MAYNDLTREEYHKLVSDRAVAIYAMLPDNDIRTDILNIMERSIHAQYPSESQNDTTSESALPISDVVKSWANIKEGDEFTVRCKVVKGKFELNLD